MTIRSPAPARRDAAGNLTAAAPAPARPPCLRIATLDVWRAHGPWPQRRREIVAQILALAPDAICLQEVVRRPGCRQDADLVAGCLAGGLRLRTSYAGRPVDGGLLGTAVLTRAAPLAVEACELPTGRAGEPCRVALAVRTRAAVAVSVRLADRQDLRLAQCASLRDFLGYLRVRHAGVPLVLGASLGCDPASPELRALCSAGALADCWDEAGTGPGHTRLAASPFGPAGPQGRVGNGRHDYLLHWPATEDVRPRWARVFGKRPLTGTALSDHLGVVVDIA